MEILFCSCLNVDVRDVTRCYENFFFSEMGPWFQGSFSVWQIISNDIDNNIYSYIASRQALKLILLHAMFY